jgi:dihydroxyacetone kinase
MLNDNVNFAQGDEVAAIVSRLGGAPLMKIYVGEHTTSLEMAGLQISPLKLDDGMKWCPKAPCDVAAILGRDKERRWKCT